MDLERNKVVGKVLADIRRERNITQVDLAHRMGNTQSAVSKLESGQTRVTVAESLLMCAAMGEEPGDFINRVYIRLSEKNLLPTLDDPSNP